MTGRAAAAAGRAERELLPFHRVLPADPLSVRRTLTDLSQHLRRACPEDARARLELVLAEVLNNIVEHGIGGRSEAAIAAEGPAAGGARVVHLLVCTAKRGLRCVITDSGMLLPGDCLAPRSLPGCNPELPEGGFGWYLIQDLVSDLTYSRAAGRNYLAFTLPADDRDAMPAATVPDQHAAQPVNAAKPL